MKHHVIKDALVHSLCGRILSRQQWDVHVYSFVCGWPAYITTYSLYNHITTRSCAHRHTHTQLPLLSRHSIAWEKVLCRPSLSWRRAWIQWIESGGPALPVCGHFNQLVTLSVDQEHLSSPLPFFKPELLLISFFFHHYFMIQRLWSTSALIFSWDYWITELTMTEESATCSHQTNNS